MLESHGTIDTSENKHRTQEEKTEMAKIIRYSEWQKKQANTGKQQVATVKPAKKATTKTSQPSHDLKVGDILTSSWGYDQTNVWYFQVVKTTNKQVTLRRIGSEMVESLTFDSWKSRPVKDKFIGDETYTRKVGNTGEKTYVRIESYMYAYPWNGKDNFNSDWH